MNNLSLKFIRWGMGLTVVAALIGYLPLGHYLLMDAMPSCPAAPIHGHAMLLSFLGMTMFGLVYRALPSWMGDREPPVKLVRLHFRLSVIAVLGVAINGTLGYEAIGHFLQPGFYYAEETPSLFARNLWFGIDGAFLTVYAAGCVIFLTVLMRGTSYEKDAPAAA